MVEAIAMAHGWEMQHDDRIVVIGQDVGANGGVFRATAGLQARFGTDRVQDPPLAEATIAGMSVGMATHGLKPVAEIQFMGFIYPALDQIVNHMSRMRYRTRGRLTCPVVIRTPHGGGIHAPEHHSEAPRPCCVTFRGFASSALRRRRAPTACCSPQFAIPIR